MTNATKAHTSPPPKAKGAIEHAMLKSMIARVEWVGPDGEMFPKDDSSKLDMTELGAEVTSRKEVLLAQKSRAIA